MQKRDAIRDFAAPRFRVGAAVLNPVSIEFKTQRFGVVEHDIHHGQVADFAKFLMMIVM
jgi:hypothetical protein